MMVISHYYIDRSDRMVPHPCHIVISLCTHSTYAFMIYVHL